MNQFIYGVNTMGFLVAGLFFWRFWRKSTDALFVFFAAAFLLFALDQFFLSLEAAVPASHDWAFFFRLAGFGLLIFAVLRKNLK
jgi:uncharacterized protein DUF5985